MVVLATSGRGNGSFIGELAVGLCGLDILFLELCSPLDDALELRCDFGERKKSSLLDLVPELLELGCDLAERNVSSLLDLPLDLVPE